jgi:hypothetical protein
MPARAGLSKEEHHDYMLQNLEKYRESLTLWDRGVAQGYLPFQALLDAKDDAVMVQPLFRPVFTIVNDRVQGLEPHPTQYHQFTKVWLAA